MMGAEVGQVVYRHYMPAVVGTIVEIVSSKRREGLGAIVRIKWDNKKRGVTDHEEHEVRDYEELVEEHERKAKLHRAILERIRNGGITLDKTSVSK